MPLLLSCVFTCRLRGSMHQLGSKLLEAFRGPWYCCSYIHGLLDLFSYVNSKFIDSSFQTLPWISVTWLTLQTWRCLIMASYDYGVFPRTNVAGNVISNLWHQVLFYSVYSRPIFRWFPLNYGVGGKYKHILFPWKSTYFRSTFCTVHLTTDKVKLWGYKYLLLVKFIFHVNDPTVMVTCF